MTDQQAFDGMPTMPIHVSFGALDYAGDHHPELGDPIKVTLYGTVSAVGDKLLKGDKIKPQITITPTSIELETHGDIDNDDKAERILEIVTDDEA